MLDNRNYMRIILLSGVMLLDLTCKRPSLLQNKSQLQSHKESVILQSDVPYSTVTKVSESWRQPNNLYLRNRGKQLEFCPSFFAAGITQNPSVLSLRAQLESLF